MEEMEALPQDDAASPDERDALRDELARRTESERTTLARLREALAASEPAIDPGLVTGETLDEVERSFAAAKLMAERVREAVRREQASTIPAGSAARGPVETKSAFEKIRVGLGGR